MGEHREWELESFQSSADVLRMMHEEMLPEAEKEELSEDDLELVMGGMSDMQAMEVVSTAYWDLCVNKKGSTQYSKNQIYEALNKCHVLNRRNRNHLTGIGKITSRLIEVLSK